MTDKLEQVKNLLRIVSILFGLMMVLFGISITIHLNLSYFSHDPVTTETNSNWRPKSITTDLPKGKKGERIRYGYELIIQTSRLIGPFATDTNLRYGGNSLTCSNCHLNAGRKIGAGSFVGVANRFPQFRGRENKIGTLEERINGCMERSMNGRTMPESSREMQAIISYMEWLSEDVPEDIEKLYKGYVKIEIPDEKADPVKGRLLYESNCQVCHMEEGKGLKTIGDQFVYTYPPLAGEHSYNDGAGMNRILTAAQFIKANMPLGTTFDAPRVTDEEAYHLAAYINELPRPSKSNKELDFPDKKLKPVSTPYGPWADDFSAEQHKYGPFMPIIEFYEEEYDIMKTK